MSDNDYDGGAELYGSEEGDITDQDAEQIVSDRDKNCFTDAAACHAAVRAEGAELNWSYQDITDQDAEWIASALTDPVVRVCQSLMCSRK